MSEYEGIIRDNTGKDLILGSDNRMPISSGSYANTSLHRNITLTNGDTEYSITFPTNTKSVMFQNRNPDPVRYAFESGKVATPTAPYFTLKGGAVYSKENVNFAEASGGILYLGCEPAYSGDVVEIEGWY